MSSAHIEVQGPSNEPKNIIECITEIRFYPNNQEQKDFQP
jgi:hypothetical protein